MDLLKIIIGCLTILLTSCFLLIWIFTENSTICPENMVQKFNYPEAKRDESIVDDLHGTKV